MHVCVPFPRWGTSLFLGAVLTALCTSVLSVNGQARCPGRYCGRIRLKENNFSQCGKCPIGWRVDMHHRLCEKCSSDAVTYDWLYLAFMAILPVLFNSYVTNKYSASQKVPGLFLSIILESALAAIFSLLSFEPHGSLIITSCGVKQLSDWYPPFYNPIPDYVHTINCTREIVHPLYSLVFVYIAFLLLLIMLFRPLLVVKWYQLRSIDSIYDALFFLPILAATHAVCAGLLYYSFPYITLVLSIISAARVLSKIHRDANLLRKLATREMACTTAIHILLHAFSIASILVFFSATNLMPLVLLAVLPLIIFILTRSCSDPAKLTFR